MERLGLSAAPELALWASNTPALAPSQGAEPDVDADLASWLLDVVHTNGDATLFDNAALPDLDAFCVRGDGTPVPAGAQTINYAVAPTTAPPKAALHDGILLSRAPATKRPRPAAVVGPATADVALLGPAGVLGRSPAPAPAPTALVPLSGRGAGRAPATATKASSQPPKKKRRRRPGSSTGAERRRRARHDKLMTDLRELVFANDDNSGESSSESIVSGSSASPRVKASTKEPTKAQVLEAAVNLIKELRRSATSHNHTVPRELLLNPRLGGLRMGGDVVAGGPLLDAPLDEQHRVTIAVFNYIKSLFRQPSRQAMLQTINTMCAKTSSNELERNASRVAAIIRVAMPVIVEGCATFGLYARLEPAQFVEYHKRMWAHPPIRNQWGDLWLMWCAPDLPYECPVDHIPAEIARKAIKQMWTFFSHPTTVEQFSSLLHGVTEKFDAFDRISTIVASTWMCACKCVGLPQTIQGIGRLHRAMYYHTEPDIATFAFKTLAGIADAIRTELLPPTHTYAASDACNPVVLMKRYAQAMR